MVGEFVGGRTFDDYRADPLLRSGVERQFEIIGEALNRLRNLDPGLAERLTNFRRIIAFRNMLIHSCRKHRAFEFPVPIPLPVPWVDPWDFTIPYP
jgi:uncharacterized protein with HEPN domain